MISRNLLKILWLSLLIGFASACLVAVSACTPPSPLSRAFLLILLLGGGAWTYLTVRILDFAKRLTGFLTLLVSGNYEADIQTRRKDELAGLVKLLSKLGDQLRTYDKLRAQKVSLTHRALELITRSVSEAIITAREFASSASSPSRTSSARSSSAICFR